MGMVKGWKFCREYWFLRKGWVKISGFGFENRQGGDENERGKVREREERWVNDMCTHTRWASVTESESRL